MQAISAKNVPRTISLVVYDDVKLLDVTGPLQVFSDALFKDGSVAYQVTIVSADGRAVSTDTVLNTGIGEIAGSLATIAAKIDNNR